MEALCYVMRNVCVLFMPGEYCSLVPAADPRGKSSVRVFGME